MRGRLWVKYFFDSLEELYTEKKYDSKQWTLFMKKVMANVGKKLNCAVAQKGDKKSMEVNILI